MPKSAEKGIYAAACRSPLCPLKSTLVFLNHLPPGANLGARCGRPRMSGALARTHVAQVENVAMRPYDFSPPWRSTIGFDRIFNLLNTEIPQDRQTYPPYDIARTGEERYRISVV
jgi:hypothetical protein